MNIYIWLVSKRDVFLLSTLLQNYMPVSRLPGSFCIFCTMCIPLLFVVHKSSVWDWCFWTTVFPATSMCGWLEGVHCLLFGDMWHVDKIEWKEFSLCMYKDRSMKKNGWHLCCFPCVAGSNSDHCQWHHDWLSDASRFLRLGRIHGKKWLQGPAFPAVLYQSKPWGCWKLKKHPCWWKTSGEQVSIVIRSYPTQFFFFFFTDFWSIKRSWNILWEKQGHQKTVRKSWQKSILSSLCMTNIDKWHTNDASQDGLG